MAALLVLEWLPISARVDTRRGGQSIARALVAFLFFLTTFLYLKVRNRLPKISAQLEGAPVGWGFLGAHFVALAAFLGLSRIPAGTSNRWDLALTPAWYGTGLLALALAGIAFVPPGTWKQLLRGTGHLCAIAAVAAALAWRFVIPLWSMWDTAAWRPAIDATFDFTAFLLRPFLPGMVLDRAAHVIGSSRFSVTVGGACSGFEGAGLMLVFSAGWLWFFRRECRFPQALLLVPASIAVMWVLNAARIGVLILIGNAGFPAIAMGGFHSQAGWISFNLVAMGVSLAASHVPWWRSGQLERSRPAPLPHDLTAAYLVPFLAILAAGMVSRAGSGGFEWLYPLRLFVAAAALWFFRASHAKFNWRVSWFGPAIGVLVFILWIALEHGSHPNNGFAATLAAAPALGRIGWLVCRVLAAVVTVPIAEELAFRGFLIRRLMAADFASLDPRRFSYFAVLLSSLAFGLMHGDRWIAGTAAGMLYAWVFLKRGSIGDAALAHAVTNGLIAAAVLIGGKWYLW